MRIAEEKEERVIQRVGGRSEGHEAWTVNSECVMGSPAGSVRGTKSLVHLSVSGYVASLSMTSSMMAWLRSRVFSDSGRPRRVDAACLQRSAVLAAF